MFCPEAVPWARQWGTEDSVILGGNRCLTKLDKLDRVGRARMPRADPCRTPGPRECHSGFEGLGLSDHGGLGCEAGVMACGGSGLGIHPKLLIALNAQPLKP